MEILSAALAWLREEWTQVKQAPAAFFLVLVVGLAGGWLAGGVFYSERIDTMTQRIEDYKERLGLAPREGRFAKLTNTELITHTGKFTRDLRSFAQPYEQRIRDLVDARQKQIDALPETDFRTRALAVQEIDGEVKFSNVVPRILQEQFDGYRERFQADAVVLRDELLARLPKNTAERLCERPAYIGETGVVIGLAPYAGAIANDLEALALALTKTVSAP